MVIVMVLVVMTVVMVRIMLSDDCGDGSLGLGDGEGGVGGGEHDGALGLLDQAVHRRVEPVIQVLDKDLPQILSPQNKLVLKILFSIKRFCCF